MPKSDDINALYDQFSGNASSFREIGRTTRAAEAATRWPLFSHMAQERGVLVPSTEDQTPDAATLSDQNEPLPQLKPADSEPPAPPAWLQRNTEAVMPHAPEASQVPSVWSVGRRPVATPPMTLFATAASSLSSARPPVSPRATEATVVKREPVWLRAPTVQSMAETAVPSPAPPPAPLSKAASQVPSRWPASATPLIPEAVIRPGASPLRRLVKTDPPTASSNASSDAQPTEDLVSVFTRLAARTSEKTEL